MIIAGFHSPARSWAPEQAFRPFPPNDQPCTHSAVYIIFILAYEKINGNNNAMPHKVRPYFSRQLLQICIIT